LVLAGLGALLGWLWWSVDVAATHPHAAFVEEILHETVEHAVRRSAAAIVAPGLDEAAVVADGAHHYFPMCEGCHAGPEVEASEIAQGLYPAPPALHEEEEWSDAELFWITKNGIKASGMPAFGPTHSDDDLWAIVAFVRTLPEMESATYEAFRPEATDADPSGRGGHAHGDGDHELGEDSGHEDHGGHAH
jgi:mono/diheme cytochrome c family protein